MRAFGMNRGGACATGVVVLLASLALSSSASAVNPVVASFEADVEDTQARRVRFEWTINPEREGEQISCTIDVDIDDPSTADEFVPDCGEDTSFEYSYELPGTYRVALMATSSAGGSDRVMVTVAVG